MRVGFLRHCIALILSALVAVSCNSAEKSEDYLSVNEHKSGEWSPELSDAEKATLFKIADDTLKWCVDGSKGKFDLGRYAITEKLKIDTGTFVTLKLGDRLRGCIGTLTAVEPLYKSVHRNAVNAAMHDTRFHQPYGPGPVSASELPELNVHISILSPVRRIASLDEFKLGEHGIIIEKGGRGAVYLPEVAVEQRWDVEQTLSSLCQKAGLSADAWREGAEFSIFSSVVLSLD